MGLVDRFLAGDRRALARLATLVEAGEPAADDALARLYLRTGAAHVVGITGPPGSGKSTLADALICEFRTDGRTVGVVAVDPTSPVSGGAVLGDRIRMMRRHADAGVFIRSMASRGRTGGLAAATTGVVHLLDAAGYDVVLVETVGAGQDAVDVASLAHTVVVLQVPGLGDGVQAIKAGLLEIGDLLVVNKADQPAADEVARQLRQAVTPTRDSATWTIPVLTTVAATGEGVAALRDRIDAHRTHLRASGEWSTRTLTAARAEVLGGLRQQLERRLLRSPEETHELRRAIADVAARRRAPASVVADLVGRLTSG